MRKELVGSSKWPIVVIVGFSQTYALVVHEDLEAHHNVGQAKYLESAFDDMRAELITMIKDGLGKKMNAEKVCLKAGLALQREAQLRVPVDTGALKASAFTALEQNAAQAAQRSKAASDAILESAKGSRETTKKKPAKQTTVYAYKNERGEWVFEE